MTTPTLASLNTAINKLTARVVALEANQITATQVEVIVRQVLPALLQVVGWTSQNPDLVVLAGSDPAAGAAAVTVTSVAATGEPMMVQLNFNGDDGGVDFTHVVQPSDDVNLIAADLAQQITSNALCATANISGEWTPGTAQFGVTHFASNPVAVSAQRHPECFQIQQGSQGLDAGPILALNRLPAGFAPPPGSNIGQITFGSCRADNPGQPSTEYGVIACNLLNNDPAALNGELAFYVAATDPTTGQQTLKKMLSITKDGVTP